MNTLDALHFTLYYNNKLYTITATPYLLPAKDGMPLCFETFVDGKNIGDINCDEDKWENDFIEDRELLNRIGSTICSKYRE